MLSSYPSHDNNFSCETDWLTVYRGEKKKHIFIIRGETGRSLMVFWGCFGLMGGLEFVESDKLFPFVLL